MASLIRFGTDGWRARIAEDYTFGNVRICAQAVANFLKNKGAGAGPLVVGYDTRFASELFAAATAEVAAGNGIKTILCDRPAPTPTVSWTVITQKAAGGVVITASHNPWQGNGFKYKPEYGGSASPEVVDKLHEQIDLIEEKGKTAERMDLEEAKDKGLVQVIYPLPAYFDQVRRLINVDDIRSAGLKVVADVMYGTGTGLFEHLIGGGKTKVEEIHNARNPLFPGIRPEPIMPNLAELCTVVVERKADIGVATDGDADRVGIVDEKGVFVTQLQVFGLLILYLLEVKGWRGAIVKSLSTTTMADRLGELYGVPVYETGVGFKYVGPLMMQHNAIIGGEESGGFGFRSHIPERDGVVASLCITDMCLKLQRKPSELVDYLYSKVGPHYYDRLDVEFHPDQRQKVIARIKEHPPKEIEGVDVAKVNTADGFKYLLQDGSWLLIRFSGTEPLIRIYAETSSPERVQRYLARGRGLAGL